MYRDLLSGIDKDSTRMHLSVPATFGGFLKVGDVATSLVALCIACNPAWPSVLLGGASVWIHQLDISGVLMASCVHVLGYILGPMDSARLRLTQTD